MCENCGWADFVERANGLLEDLNELPERAASFAEGVREKVEGMISWANENEHVTEKMDAALGNMQGGVDKWLRR